MNKYDNFSSNLAILKRAEEEDLNNEFIQSGIIGKFAMQFELSWKLLKEALEYEGRSEASSGSPRAILKAAYVVYDFIDEDIWISMLRERNSVQHEYDSRAARATVDTIIAEYIPEFVKLNDSLIAYYGKDALSRF